ncbi:unnamed protein product [Gordionus sp. m RMFG-2023]|uniref:microtubule-associated proteins 1A/1B light chain 3A-like n=1 Tax=Gordionus sp. m RMFG-2023 TaxID=3053472 RepID=UPI0030E394A1
MDSLRTPKKPFTTPNSNSSPYHSGERKGPIKTSHNNSSLKIPYQLTLDISSESAGSGDESDIGRKKVAVYPKRYKSMFYKEKTPFAMRQMEALEVKKSHPGKIPVIIERHKNEKILPILNKYKFLIPQELTISHLLGILRNRISINSMQTIYLLIADGKSMCNLSCPIVDVYQNFRDPDGFLYMKYASQEFYG